MTEPRGKMKSKWYRWECGDCQGFGPWTQNVLHARSDYWGHGGGYKECRTDNGQIYVRKSDGKPPQHDRNDRLTTPSSSAPKQEMEE